MGVACARPIPQVTYKSKTTPRSTINYESIPIAHIVTDADGSLKIKQAEAFLDSKF